MRIRTEADRVTFEQHVSEKLGVGDNGIVSLRLFRQCLAALRPHELVACWFRHGAAVLPEKCLVSFAAQLRDEIRLAAKKKSGVLARAQGAETPPADKPESADELERVIVGLLNSWLEKIRPMLPRRSDLFGWVYLPGGVAYELAAAKLPCSQRRLLIGLILTDLRRKMPWLTSRLVCAMAFRPSAFDGKRSTAPDGVEPWGPLYRRVVIAKGKRASRYLFVPNRPMKAIQKSLLRVLQPEVDRCLSADVFGARAGVSGPTFANAAAHLNRALLVSFDIRDFFPSTTVSDVIRGLQFLSRQSSLAVDAARGSAYPEAFAGKAAFQRIEWSDEVRTFVAKVGTWRGRLPQGSPLSPLLANIAFSPFDDEICNRLRERFGIGAVKYTRYFDDITISVSRLRGADTNITPEVFQKRCEALIAAELANTRYRLNRKKTRVSTAADGHLVTGLRVGKDTVEPPRHLRRHARAVSHSLRRKPFVDLAVAWHLSAARPTVNFETILRGHRFERGRLGSRKISAEKLATAFLRHVYPDLRLTRLLVDWFPWQERCSPDEERLTGKKVWPVLEWVLAALWTGKATSCRPFSASGELLTDHVIIRQGGVDVCRLEAESTLGFFFLGRNKAVAVAEYWHYLKGLSSYLASCPNSDAFRVIAELHDDLADAISHIEIQSDDHPEPVQQAELTDFPLTGRQHFHDMASQVVGYLREFIRVLGIPPGPAFGQLCDRFNDELATEWSGFESWVNTASQLTVQLCPRLPSGDVRSKGISYIDLYQYLVVKPSAASGQLAPDYACVKQFESGLRLGPRAHEGRLRDAQTKITETLLDLFKSAVQQRSMGVGWDEGLYQNDWYGVPDERLRTLTNDLERLHDLATSTIADRRLFRMESSHERHDVRKALLSGTTIASSDRVWEELEHVGFQIYKLLCESIEEDLCEAVPPAGVDHPRSWKRREVWKRSRRLADRADTFTLVEMLRNRAAHGKSPERRDDWVRIQNKARDLLGRTWKSSSGPKHPKYAADDDLVLTPKEGTILRTEMLRAVNAWLAKVVDSSWWRLGSPG
jgi:hypothetical protein